MTHDPNTTDDPRIGQILDGRFELTEFIARGGMGEVYKAVQRPLDRVVAIKLLADVSDGIEEFRKRFFLEASLCARLSHPNIIRIFDYGCHEETTYYIAMEYLEGQTLQELLTQTGPLQPRRAVAIMKQVSAALIEAHEAGLVHRDLKPSNLFVTLDALGEEFIKILDFGVVKQMTVDLEFTHAGSTLGSPLYMSPEQIRDAELDGRSDLYSLGIILFKLLTGALPFMASAVLQMLMKHLSESPPTFKEVNPDAAVPEVLEQITRKLLHKSPTDRYTDALSLLQALIECEEGLPSLTPTIAEAQQLDPWSPDTLLHTGMADLPTGTMPIPHEKVPEPEHQQAPVSEPAMSSEMTDLRTVEIQELSQQDLQGYVAFIDLNCPYCYALHERLVRWGLESKIEWCMVEHASHILDTPFDLHQEHLLSTEVFEVHHRAPDVELLLPPQRCRSTTATRLIIHIQRQFPDQAGEFRLAVYRALWQEGRDIGEIDVLKKLLIQREMPAELLELCEEEPPELTAWQDDWDRGDFDHCIPVLTHPASGRVLIGLVNQRTLTEFFLKERSRVVDSTVCYYQQQPTILMCGWMSHLWQLLADVRGCCEILQAPTAQRAEELLNEIAVPDLLVIECEHVDKKAMESLAKLARSRSVPWVVATREPTPEKEIEVLSMGAVEYLPVTGEALVARARLGRILRDRYNLDRIEQQTRTDELTKLPTRRSLLEQLESEWERSSRTQSPLSFVLLDLDGFKAYNKAHGYLSGDRSLVMLAEILKHQISRPGDMLARFGGNEFGVLLPATGSQEAQEQAEILRQCIISAGIENRAIPGGGILKASVGTATMKPGPTASIHELVDQASQSLRTSRQS